MDEIYDFGNANIPKQIMGIYGIFNSKYYYIGQAKDIRKRWRCHRNHCSKNKHDNSFIQRVYNKYKETDPYKIQILEICSESDLTDRETFWVTEYGEKTGLICMNLCDPREPGMRKDNPRTKQVYQFDEFGNLLGNWKGIPEASINTGVSEPIIAACLQNRCKHGGGFIWSYNEKIDIKDYTIYRKGDENYIPYNTKKVIQFSINGDFIKEWNSIIEAAETLGIDNGAVTHVCKRELGSTGGFVWRYEGDVVTEQDFERIQKIIPCCKYDRDGNLIKRFSSCKEAAEEWGVVYQTIHNACKSRNTYKGFIYLYEGDEPTDDDLWKAYCSKNSPVIQILPDDTERLFKSCAHASEELNINKSGIVCCVNGYRKTAHGYRWRHATKEDWLKYKNICQY